MNESQANEGNVYERIKLGEFEYEINAPREYAQRRMDEMINFIAPRGVVIATLDSTLVNQTEEEDAPLLYQSNDAPKTSAATNSNGHQSSSDLLPLYRKFDPQDQYEQVLFITYFLTICSELEHATYDACDKIYLELLRLGVSKPGNMRQYVMTGVERKHIFKPNYKRGAFALTEQGEEFVKERLKG